MVAASLLTTLLFAFAISIFAKPVLELKSPTVIRSPLVKRHSLANYNVMEMDMRRISYLGRRAGYENDRKSVGIKNGTKSGVTKNDSKSSASGIKTAYTCDIAVGNPPTHCK
jgi:hypothetical protein